MTRIPRSAASLRRAAVRPVAALCGAALATTALTTAALALPPEPASAPAGAHVAAAPPAAAVSNVAPLGNSHSPMDITADGVETSQPQHLTIFRGNVEVINDTTRLRTPELRVYNKAKAAGAPDQPPNGSNGIIGADSGNIDHVEASGPVYYVTPTQNARGDSLLWQKDADIITLTGHVVLVQGKSVAKGDKLIMYRKTGQNQLISNSPQNPTGRVRVILYPQDQQNGAKPGAPARTPAR